MIVMGMSEYLEWAEDLTLTQTGQLAESDHDYWQCSNEGS